MCSWTSDGDPELPASRVEKQMFSDIKFVTREREVGHFLGGRIILFK